MSDSTGPATHTISARRRRWLPFEYRLMVLSLGGGALALVLAFGLLWFAGVSTKVIVTFGGLVTAAWLAGGLMVYAELVHAFRTLSNVLMALREGDFSLRAAAGSQADALGELCREVNAFGDTLQRNRLDAIEATTLMRRLMAEMDVAVFAFNEERRLRLINRAGERLLGQAEARLLDRTATDLDLAFLVEDDAGEIVEHTFNGVSGRWGVRRGSFRLGGVTHNYSILTNLSQTLRQEEREAWQRLVRVLGHEINNSLTPIKSMAGTLGQILIRDPLPDDWATDARQVLSTIESRADALGRFTSTYAKLARLPQPTPRKIELQTLIARVAELGTLGEIRYPRAEPFPVHADPDQLEQVFINLIQNAVEAMDGDSGGVEITWGNQDGAAVIHVLDRGPGLANAANVFVPFFTTKPGGNGIGLVLCRQIIEAHGGSLTLQNRETGGCDACLRLPAS